MIGYEHQNFCSAQIVLKIDHLLIKGLIVKIDNRIASAKKRNTKNYRFCQTMTFENFLEN